MAISDIAQQVISAQVGILRNRFTKLGADKGAHEAAATKIGAQMADIETQLSALEKDIAELSDQEPKSKAKSKSR